MVSVALDRAIDYAPSASIKGADETINIRVLYWGGIRAQTGCAKEEITLAAGATVADAAATIGERHKALQAHFGSVRWALDLEFVDDDTALVDGAELALIPPVQGGAPERVLVSEAPIDIARVQAEVTSPEAGACVLFTGTVRNHSRGERVDHLEYEAYVPMVERQLAKIIACCEQDNDGVAVAIAHRYGSLEIGDISVAIAAASAHRAEAFAASRQAIELIKTDVPIWKREIGAAGQQWVGWGGG